MPARVNPYTPGAGDMPRALVGRDEQLGLAETVRTQLEARYAANCLLFTGLRGVGKTVLLKEVRNRLIAGGWLATYVQIRPSVPVDRAFAEVALRAKDQLTFGTKVTRALKTLGRRGGSLSVMGNGAGIGAGDTRVLTATASSPRSSPSSARRPSPMGSVSRSSSTSSRHSRTMRWPI